MINLLKIIILFSMFFSSATYSFAKEWYIENLLQINTWVEAFDIELIEIDDYYFADENLQNTYEEFKRTSQLLKREIIRKYENDEFGYYQTKWVITNYKKFVYYTNSIFYYLSLKDEGVNDSEIDNAILESYTKIRTYYKRLKYLVNK